MSWVSNIGGYAKSAAQWISNQAAYGPVRFPFGKEGDPTIGLMALGGAIFGAVKGASGRGRYHGFVKGFLRELGKGLVGGCIFGALLVGFQLWAPPQRPATATP